MKFIFCQSPIDRKSPDDLYESEANAAINSGADIELIDFEALVAEKNIEKCLRSISKSDNCRTAIYRGWMMTPLNYEMLFDGLQKRGIGLINNPLQYQFCHYLPEWLSKLNELTPRTSILRMRCDEKLSLKKLEECLAIFGNKPIIVKDFVKSAKHHWEEACFIPIASNTEKAASVCEKFLELRGPDLEGGLVFREFLKFKSIGVHPKSKMPLTEEFRAFVYHGELLATMNYWDEGNYPVEKLQFDSLLSAVKNIPSNFFTVDFARLENNQLMIIELGDGQVSGLPDNMDLRDFYARLQSKTDK